MHNDETYKVAQAPEGSDRERDNQFYELLAGGAKTRLLEVFVELEMATVLGQEGRIVPEVGPAARAGPAPVEKQDGRSLTELVVVHAQPVSHLGVAALGQCRGAHRRPRGAKTSCGGW